MSKYTEGPWKVIDGHYPGFLKIVGASFEPSIVRVATDLDFKDFCARTADAHLMAAAPCLLEALEKAITRMEEDAVAIDGECGMGWSLERLEAESKLPEEIIIARAAIARAKGESQ